MDNPKKILICGIISVAIIGVIASANTILDRFTSNNGLAIQSNVQRAVNSNSDLSSSSIEQFENQFCGVDSSLNSNNYVTEYKLPHTCEMPLGITVDNQAGKIWYVSTKEGTLGSYNLITKRFDKEISIPIWKVRKNPIDFSNVWSVKVNPIGGSVWFTDEKQNAIWKYSKSVGFDIYKVPDSSSIFGTTSPMALGFDSRGNVYFVGMHSPVLWFGNSTLMKNGTSNGITKIPMPVNNFKGIDSKQISIGSMTLDNRRNVIWISLSALNSLLVLSSISAIFMA